MSQLNGNGKPVTTLTIQLGWFYLVLTGFSNSGQDEALMDVVSFFQAFARVHWQNSLEEQVGQALPHHPPAIFCQAFTLIPINATYLVVLYL